MCCSRLHRTSGHSAWVDKNRCRSDSQRLILKSAWTTSFRKTVFRIGRFNWMFHRPRTTSTAVRMNSNLLSESYTAVATRRWIATKSQRSSTLHRASTTALTIPWLTLALLVPPRLSWDQERRWSRRRKESIKRRSWSESRSFFFFHSHASVSCISSGKGTGRT